MHKKAHSSKEEAHYIRRFHSSKVGENRKQDGGKDRNRKQGSNRTQDSNRKQDS